MTMYAWRDAMGASGELEDDDCGYCGAPAFYQDPKWEPIAALKDRVRETRSRVAVPFCHVEKDHIRRGVARGIHLRSEDILVTWEDGEKGTLKRYDRETYQPIPAELESRVNEKLRLRDELHAKVAALRVEVEEELAPYRNSPNYDAKPGTPGRTKQTLEGLVKQAMAQAAARKNGAEEKANASNDA